MDRFPHPGLFHCWSEQCNGGGGVINKGRPTPNFGEPSQLVAVPAYDKVPTLLILRRRRPSSSFENGPKIFIWDLTFLELADIASRCKGLRGFHFRKLPRRSSLTQT